MGRYKKSVVESKLEESESTILHDGVEYLRRDIIIPAYVRRKDGPWEIGQSYAIRTVTMIDHGILVDLTPTDFVLAEAAWIADTGRWSDFINGNVDPNEVEPFPRDKIVLVNRGAYIDACQLDKKFLEVK